MRFLVIMTCVVCACISITFAEEIHESVLSADTAALDPASAPGAAAQESPPERKLISAETGEPVSSTAAQIIEVPNQLTVEKAEELLIQNNLAVTAARFGVDSARAQRIVAGYHPNPSLLLAPQQFNTAFPKRFLVENNTISASQRSFTFEFDLPIETGGKRHKRINNAQSQIEAAEAQVLDAIRTQLFQMKSAYYSAVLARENARVAAEVLESVDATEKLVKRQVGAGNIPEAQLITLQANRIQFEQALITAQLAYEQSIRDLLNFMGATPADVIGAAAVPDAKPAGLSAIQLAGDLDAKPVSDTLDDLRRKTELRPDVVVAQRSVEAAERGLELAHALRSPDISVGTQYVRTGGDNTVGMSFTVPLQLFNHKEGEICQAEAQLNTVRTQLKQAKLQALTDVDKSWRAYELNQQLVKLYDETAVSRAKQSLDIAEKAYERGGTSLLEVLDARRTYRQTLVARDQARFSLIQSILQLEQAANLSIGR